MSSKNADAPQQRRSWSIARRLTVLYCLSAFVLLSLASGYLYWGLKNNLAEEDHELLGDMVNVIRFIMRDRPDDISALNVIAGAIAEIGATHGAMAEVRLDCNGEALTARLTRASIERLGLQTGTQVFALIKSVAIERRSLGKA